VKLTFKLRYRTSFGQSLWVTGHHPALGDGEEARAVPLAYFNEEFWQVTLSFPRGARVPAGDVPYHYLLRQANGAMTADWGHDRRLHPAFFKLEEVVQVDSWNDAGFAGNVFYTEPFRKGLLRAYETAFSPSGAKRPTHTFRVKAPLLERGQTLCLLGSAPSLGKWDPRKPALLRRTPGETHLRVELDLTGESFPFEYKYGVFDTERDAFVRYEDGDNRRVDEPAAARRQVILDDGFARLPVDMWRGAGVAIPVFSLRSERSFGVGEFTDLKPLADWCQRTGLKLIQILPVNDTTATHTWLDSYPYSAISAFALNPIYLNLGEMATGRNRRLLLQAEAERQRLDALPELDYAAVMAAKLGLLKAIFPLQKAATFRSRDYKAFHAENRHWLDPYAAFCCLRDRYGTADFRRWPAHQRCTPDTLAALTADHAPEAEVVGFHCFVQYHLHRQLQDAAAYAHGRGVILKGDIPIGVLGQGADTWQAPEMFELGTQAGAPPDPFAERGQNWGFPTYNWARMRQDGFAWWKRRLAQMAHYFDAFRLDHVLGFFRIWSIPTHAVEGILGHFEPAIPVSLEEFGTRGIPFDRARFVEPFITDAVLGELFGPEAEAVKARYLRPAEAGQYALRTSFATQRQVEAHFARLEPTPENQKRRAGLFDLISNVLLFEVEGSGGRQFHFRFHIETTTSFRALERGTQEQLMELSVDYFFRRQDAFWKREGLQKLPALQRATNMLACGEDLGLVPACVPEVMKSLGLLSLEVQRMPKAAGRAFSKPSEAPYLSVVTPSTHDMSTIRGWWAEDPQVTQRFYNEELGLPGAAPEACSGTLNEAIVRQHLASPAIWSVFQWQDLLGMDEGLRRAEAGAERINVPADPKHHWGYRMHLTLETLLGAEALNRRLRALLRAQGREGLSERAGR
jgi:4-alpha-glucanotransferase